MRSVVLGSLALLLGACAKPAPAVVDKPAAIAHVPNSGRFAGSEACKPCHAAIFERWRVTRMANVVRDPKVHPEAVLGDFAAENPVRNFALADVAFVYGSRWKQRYFARRGDDLIPLDAQWDVTKRAWKPYRVPDGTDWWVSAYGKTNAERPTGATCDGCHSVGYDLATKRPVEWNVGCEKCHGPAADHARAPSKANVVNPAKLDPVAANDVCIQCHSQGRPRDAAIGAVDWPVGFVVGVAGKDRLADTWRLEDHAPGTTTFTHFPDGTAHKNRMQGNDYVQSEMYGHAITCANCHDAHGTPNPGLLVRATDDQMCADCHEPGGVLGPRETTLAEHTHHAGGVACVDCHMPRIETTLGDVMVRSHTMKIIPPSVTGMPNSCEWGACHRGKDAAWATAAMRGWPSVSPWRL